MDSLRSHLNLHGSICSHLDSLGLTCFHAAGYQAGRWIAQQDSLQAPGDTVVQHLHVRPHTKKYESRVACAARELSLTPQRKKNNLEPTSTKSQQSRSRSKAADESCKTNGTTSWCRGHQPDLKKTRNLGLTWTHLDSLGLT